MKIKILEKFILPTLIVLFFVFLPDWLCMTSPGKVAEWFMNTPIVRMLFKGIGIVLAFLYLSGSLSKRNS